MKGNWDAAAFRFHVGMSRGYILRTLINEVADDGVFVGGSSSNLVVVGNGFSNVFNHGINTGPFHNDDIQITGLNGGKIFDNTMQGHALELFAESGQTIQNVNVDRNWGGMCGADGGDIGCQPVSAPGGPGHLNSSTVFCAGAPTARISGHFMKTWSNGSDHGSDWIPQTAIADGQPGWQVGFLNYLDSNNQATLNKPSFAVEVPSGCAVDGTFGYATTSIAQFLAASNVPHNVFRAAYAATDLPAIMADYGFAFD
jgi:hypothetical protein